MHLNNKSGAEKRLIRWKGEGGEEKLARYLVAGEAAAFKVRNLNTNYRVQEVKGKYRRT